MPNSGYDDEDNERERIFYPIKDSKSFEHKTKLIGRLGNNLPAVNNLVKAEKYVKIVVPLKNLSNFMFNLDFSMINSEIELVLKWTEDCVLTEKATREAKDREDGPPVLNPAAAINRPEDLKFSFTDCKMYVPVVTLQTEYQNQLYKDLKTEISIDYK